jgi:hypothetical protein
MPDEWNNFQQNPVDQPFAIDFLQREVGQRFPFLSQVNRQGSIRVPHGCVADQEVSVHARFATGRWPSSWRAWFASTPAGSCLQTFRRRSWSAKWRSDMGCRVISIKPLARASLTTSWKLCLNFSWIEGRRRLPRNVLIFIRSVQTKYDLDRRDRDLSEKARALHTERLKTNIAS